MLRKLALLAFLTTAVSCGPDKRECSGPRPLFRVALQLQDRPLAPDTVVNVTYGGTGTDQYDLSDPTANHKVIFCKPSKRDCVALDSASDSGAAGAAGASDEPNAVEALCCDLWTGGYTHLEVHATGQESSEWDLYPREHECTVNQSIVLDSPDGG